MLPASTVNNGRRGAMCSLELTGNIYNSCPGTVPFPHLPHHGISKCSVGRPLPPRTPPLVNHIIAIASIRCDEEMGWMPAGRHVTMVANEHSFRDISACKLVNQTVNFEHSLADFAYPIAEPQFSPVPYFTWIHLPWNRKVIFEQSQGLLQVSMVAYCCLFCEIARATFLVRLQIILSYESIPPAFATAGPVSFGKRPPSMAKHEYGKPAEYSARQIYERALCCRIVPWHLRPLLRGTMLGSLLLARGRATSNSTSQHLVRKEPSMGYMSVFQPGEA